MGSLKSPAKSAHFNSGRTRTRPCVYCGAFFFDLERLRRHEEAEGEKFRAEQQKIVRERPGLRDNIIPPPPVRPVINHHQSDHHHQHQQRVPPPQHHHQNNLNVVFYRIDRTVEEFGEDWEEDRGQLYPPFYQAFVHARRQDRAGMVKRYRKAGSRVTQLFRLDERSAPGPVVLRRASCSSSSSPPTEPSSTQGGR